MNDKRRRIGAVSLALILGCTAAQAGDEFVSTGGDWADGANWNSGEYPTAEEGYLNTTAYLSTVVPTNMWAFRMGQTGDAIFSILPGGEYEATQHTSWGSWLGMASGYSATINQSGGSLTVYELEVGSQDGSFGYYNLSTGTVSVAGVLYDRSLYIGATKNAYKKSSLGGTGTFSMTGGTLLTRGGVQLGHSSLSGEGTFEVWGTGPDEIGIGSYSTNNYTGFWEQYSNSTLRVGISADGITPIHLNGGATTNATALFAEGSVLDVSFMDGYSEVGSWPIMVCEGEMVNAGMVFADSVDANWGFMVSNNTLMVGYGLGWPAGNPTSVILPPSPGRTIYWTGAGGDTSSSNAANWALDTVGTPATWGIYSKDTIYIGDSSVVETGVVSEVDYDGTADYNDQNLLYIGNNRTGVLNMNSGTLTFTQSSSSRQQIGLGGVDGDGTINMNGGDMSFNTLRLGIAGSKGAINVNSGTLDVARSSETLDGIATSISLGYSSVGTGDLTISGGSLITRGGVHIARSGGASSFCVEGSGASSIYIGKEANSVDGAWYQHAAGTLKILLDEGGVTPIYIRDSDNTHANGGNVYFDTGSLLDVDFDNVDGSNGSWDVMQWEGSLMTSNLAFAASVDTNIWSFEFVDAGVSTNGLDTLRISASGFAPTVTPDVQTFSVSGTDVSLTWDSEPGYSYRVLSAPSLIGSTWTTNVDAIPSSGTSTSTNLTTSDTTVFYKIEAY